MLPRLLHPLSSVLHCVALRTRARESCWVLLVQCWASGGRGDAIFVISELGSVVLCCGGSAGLDDSEDLMVLYGFVVVGYESGESINQHD